LTKNWKQTLRFVWAAQLLAIMGFAATNPIYPYYIQSLGVEQDMIARWSGFVISASSLSMGVMGPIWGALGDRHGRKIMVMRAMFGGAVIIGLMGFSQNVWQLFILRFIQGALTGTVTAATALVASVTPRQRLGETLGKLQLAIFMGQSFGPMMGGFIADMLGYRATFWTTSLFLLVAGALILTKVQENFVPMQEGTVEPILKGLGHDFGMLLTGSLLGLVLALHFALRVGVRMASPIIPLVIQDLMPGSSLLGSASGLLTTLSGIGSAIAAPAIGRWADRGNGRTYLILSAFLAAAAMLIQAVAPTYWLLLLGQFLLGFGIGGTLAVLSAYIGRLAPADKVGTAFGLDAMAVSMSSAVGPSLGGWLSDTVARRSPLTIGGIAMALAGLAVFRLPKESSSQPQTETDAEPDVAQCGNVVSAPGECTSRSGAG
jgi:MFS transporter, DHA1 family, multidrug resistance protein